MRAALPLVGVCLLTVAALFIRLQGLRGPDGALDTDESRLALAAQGVLATGLPILPSGRIYTRGLLSAYLMAPSLRLFGPHDFAARLPSAVFGTALIPVAYVFGRAVAGPAVGLCAAAFTMVHPELISWSAQAWMPSLFTLVFVGAAYLLFLGYGHDRARMQVAGAAGFVVALFVHELAVLLPMAVLATIAARATRRDFAWFAGQGSLVAFAVLGGGLVMLAVLGLLLRAGTIAGPVAEFRAHLVPWLTNVRLEYYYRVLVRDYPLLLAAAALGVLLLRWSPNTGVLFLYMTLAAGVVTLGFIVYHTQQRYAIMLLPLFAIAAAWTIVEGLRLVGERWRSKPAGGAGVPAIALALIFGLSLRGDLAEIARADDSLKRSWLQEFQAVGPAPDDLLFSDVPTIIAFYRGRADYWARVIDYERYGYLSGGEIREVYTNAVRVGSEEDFLRIVAANPGRRLWYVGRLKRFFMGDFFEPALRLRLARSAQLAKRTADGWVILRIDLGASEVGPR